MRLLAWLSVCNTHESAHNCHSPPAGGVSRLLSTRDRVDMTSVASPRLVQQHSPVCSLQGGVAEANVSRGRRCVTVCLLSADTGLTQLRREFHGKQRCLPTHDCYFCSIFAFQGNVCTYQIQIRFLSAVCLLPSSFWFHIPSQRESLTPCARAMWQCLLDIV